jgi:hypothetical protein
MIEWIEKNRFLRSVVGTAAAARGQTSSHFEQRISINNHIDCITSLMENYETYKNYSDQISYLAWTHNDPKAWSYSDRNLELRALDETIEILHVNELVAAEIERNMSAIDLVISMTTVDELLRKHTELEERIVRLLPFAIESINSMLTITRRFVNAEHYADPQQVPLTPAIPEHKSLELLPEYTFGKTPIYKVMHEVIDRYNTCVPYLSPRIDKFMQQRRRRFQSFRKLNEHVCLYHEHLEALQMDREIYLKQHAKQQQIKEHASLFMTQLLLQPAGFDLDGVSKLVNETMSFITQSYWQERLTDIESSIEAEQREFHHEMNISIPDAIRMEMLLPDGTDYMKKYNFNHDVFAASDTGGGNNGVRLQECKLFENHLYDHMLDVEHRRSFLTSLSNNSLDISAKAKLIDMVSSIIELPMNDIEGEIKRLKVASDEMKVLCREISSQLNTMKAGDNTLAYLLDGIHELRRLMDKVLGKTRDPLTQKLSIGEKEFMKWRRATPDSAGVSIQGTAFAVEVSECFPGKDMDEYIQDMRFLYKVASNNHE